MAARIEGQLNRGRRRLLRGIAGWMLAVLPASALAWWLAAGPGGVIVHALLLWFSLGLRSLREHTLPIFHALAARDLAAARALTARIVSRDTAHEDASGLARAGAESLLENGNDAVFGTLFWFMVAGGPGALLFRLANTLDAMWGYRTPRYELFGRVAARIDDGLNYLPARLTALSYVLLAPRGGHLRAWRCWRRQAPAWSSPNAGPVMASGAELRRRDRAAPAPGHRRAGRAGRHPACMASRIQGDPAVGGAHAHIWSRTSCLNTAAIYARRRSATGATTGSTSRPASIHGAIRFPCWRRTPGTGCLKPIPR
jgi:CobD/Cbib protein